MRCTMQTRTLHRVLSITSAPTDIQSVAPVCVLLLASCFLLAAYSSFFVCLLFFRFLVVG